MRKIFVIFSSVLALVSCQKAEIRDEGCGLKPDGAEISIVSEGVRTTYAHGEVSPGVQGLQTGWKFGDKIGLYAYADGVLYDGNNAYNASSTALSTSFNAASKPTKFVPSALAHKFYAYYPYNGSPEYEDGKLVVFLGSRQEQACANDASHLRNTDFLYATPVTVYDQNPEIPMTFNHAFSVIELDLTTKRSSVEITEVEVSCADGALCGKGKVDIAGTGAFEMNSGAAVGRVILSFTENPVIRSTDTGPAKLYLQILPGHAGKEFTITITDKEYKTVYRKKPASNIPAGANVPIAISVGMPSKCDYGVSSTTPTLVWSKKVSEIAGVVNPANVNHLAYSDGHLVLGENGNFAPAYVDALTGTAQGTLDLSALSAYGNDYALCSDDNGKIWAVNSVINPGVATDAHIFATADVGTPAHILSATSAKRSIGAGHRFGTKLSAAGPDANGLVLLSSPYYHNTNAANRMCSYFTVSKNETTVSFGWPNVRWSLESQTTWGINCDCVWESTTRGSGGTVYSVTSAFTLASQVSGYEKYNHLVISKGTGTDGSPSYFTASTDVYGLQTYASDTQRSYSTAIDFVVFNNAKYIAYNSVRTGTYYGSVGTVTISPAEGPRPYNTCDRVMLMDVTDGISEPTFLSRNHIHGSAYVSQKAVSNVNSYGDVIFRVSEDGYYLYAYVMFAAGGEVACYRYDCIARI